MCPYPRLPPHPNFMNHMSKNQYAIRYAPPIAVKDEPHRILDTVGGNYGTTEISSDDVGEVMTAGTITASRIEEIQTATWGEEDSAY